MPGIYQINDSSQTSSNVKMGQFFFFQVLFGMSTFSRTHVQVRIFNNFFTLDFDIHCNHHGYLSQTRQITIGETNFVLMIDKIFTKLSFLTFSPHIFLERGGCRGKNVHFKLDLL